VQFTSDASSPGDSEALLATDARREGGCGGVFPALIPRPADCRRRDDAVSRRNNAKLRRGPPGKRLLAAGTGCMAAASYINVAGGGETYMDVGGAAELVAAPGKLHRLKSGFPEDFHGFTPWK